MAFPNISDILATTIESRTKKVADNVTDNRAKSKQFLVDQRFFRSFPLPKTPTLVTTLVMTYCLLA